MINDYGNTFNMFDEVFEGFYHKNRKFVHVVEEKWRNIKENYRNMIDKLIAEWFKKIKLSTLS